MNTIEETVKTEGLHRDLVVQFEDQLIHELATTIIHHRKAHIL
jgi:hypothetical protein